MTLRTMPNRATIAGLLPMALIVAMMFTATFFTFLQTDDFCTYGRVIHLQGGNPFAETLNLYMHWTGRYASSFLIALTASSSRWLPVWIGYSATLAAYMGLFAWACVGISRLPSAAGKANPVLAMTLLATTLVVMPSKLEQFFWVTGAAVYFVGATFLLLLLVAIVRQTPGATSRRLGEVWIIALIVATTGTNELVGLVAGACLLWDYVDGVRNGQAMHRRKLLRIAIYGVALLVTVLAPGNFARDAASAVTTRHQVFPATRQMLASLMDFTHALGSVDLVPLVACLALSALSGAFATSGDRLREVRSWVPQAVILVLSFPGQAWTYSFLTGEPAPGRVLNQAFLLALAGACLLCALLGHRFLGDLARRVTGPGFAAIVAGGGIMLALSAPFQAFAHSLVSFAPRWHAEQLQRHEGLSSLEGTSRTAYVKPFDFGDSAPPTFQGGDLTADGSHWINRCVASYYGIPGVVSMRRTSY